MKNHNLARPSKTLFLVFLVSSMVAFGAMVSYIDATHGQLSAFLDQSSPTISIRDITNPNQTSYNLVTIPADLTNAEPDGETDLLTIAVTVTDADSNRNGTHQEGVKVRACTPDCTETGNSFANFDLIESLTTPGKFEGNVVITNDSAKNPSNFFVDNGEKFALCYNPLTGRCALGDTEGAEPLARANFEFTFGKDKGVDQSGTAELDDHIFTQGEVFNSFIVFKPVVHAVDLDFTGTANEIKVTMSYANALFGNRDQTDLVIGYTPEHPIFGFADQFVSMGAFLDEGAETITSTVTDPFQACTDAGLNDPSICSFSGRYSLVFPSGTTGSGGGGGLVSPSLVVNALGGLAIFTAPSSPPPAPPPPPPGGNGDGGSPSADPTAAALAGSPPLLLLWTGYLSDDLRLLLETHDPYRVLEPISDSEIEMPITIDGKGYPLTGRSNTITTNIVYSGEPVPLKIVYYETDLVHLGLYTNLRDANDKIYDSDTYIIYNKDKPIEIVDPNGYFSDVDLTVNKVGAVKYEVNFDITFAKPMEKSHIILRAWDFGLSSADTAIEDAWEVVEPSDFVKQVETPVTDLLAEEVIETEPSVIESEMGPKKIPVWIKNNAKWWAEGQIRDSDFIAGVEYLIEQEIIDVLETEPSDGVADLEEIPEWVKSNAGWWAQGLISDEDFVWGIEFLIEKGIINV